MVRWKVFREKAEQNSLDTIFFQPKKYSREHHSLSKGHFSSDFLQGVYTN